MLNWDTSEAEKLESDLLESAVHAHIGASDVVHEQAVRFRNDWRDNARKSAGKHGKHYPSSITLEQVGGEAVYEVGPDTTLPQGGMGRGFEWGGVNQPPHNDMGQAIVAVPDRFEAAVKTWSEKLL
ncbi:hypothetical protein FXF51_06130 [Nonomuraea sp. PA05]|uniref:hypothetical protein n=1 Tax=Nonomuraea sp. PA05 TaxID=2604466 RepID=UPI0011D66135|nr:hypothetical protein [Nonomuraea sp. PA05]TYB69738.1 hypothetical protein FXF51_06130 [Nonomuraea sp. PA05]